uniref:Uncharacterized protein n=1 Tax=Romanomermis culicivorax TaxID=13658 RepID=A0A915IP54_ROMCU
MAEQENVKCNIKKLADSQNFKCKVPNQFREIFPFSISYDSNNQFREIFPFSISYDSNSN